MRIVLAVLLVVLTAGPAEAQRLENAWYDLKHGALDIGYIWTSPLRIKTRDLPAMGAVAGATAVALVYDDEIQAWIRDHPHTLVIEALQPWREEELGEQLGDIWFFIRASGAAWLVGLAVDSRTLREGAMGCASAGIAQTLARRNVLYNLVKRTRPDSARGPYEFDVPGSRIWKYRSFYGGHAANAMTCISYLNNRFDLGYLEPVLYTLALGTGVARIVDGAHWTSDTVLGIAVGYAVGRTVALRMKARERGREKQEPSGELLLDYTDGRLTMGWQIRH